MFALYELQTTAEAIWAYMRLHKAYYEDCAAAGVQCAYQHTAATVTSDVSDHVRTLAVLMGMNVVVTFGPAVTRPAVTGLAVTARPSLKSAVTAGRLSSCVEYRVAAACACM
jgi:hypothetical protein